MVTFTMFSKFVVFVAKIYRILKTGNAENTVKKYPMTDNFPYRTKTKITQHKLKPGDRSTNPIAERIEVKII